MYNRQECTQTRRGVMARRAMLSYQMGLGHELSIQDYKAVIGDFRYNDSKQGGD